MATTALALVAAPLGFAAAPAAAIPSTGLVINEVYGGGGNSGATFNNDFIELKNLGAANVNLAGLSLQYRAAGGTGTPTNVLALPSVALPAGQTFLVAGAAGTGPAPALPTPDATTGINLSGTGGQVFLARIPVGVDPNNPAGGSGSTFTSDVIDFVGWGGSTTSFEGTRAGATTNPSSVSRAPAGADTDVNSADFSVTNPPTPVACTGCAVVPPEEFEGSIAEIQGDTAVTSHFGDTVTTTGVVTASYPTGGFNGFVIQTGGTGGAVADTTAGSDAIFVWGGSDGFPTYPTIGASLEVTGTAVEGGGPATGLTQIIVDDNTGVVALTGGDALAPVLPRSIPLPTTTAAREAHESGLLDPTNDFTVTNSFSINRFAEIGLASGSTPLIQPTDVQLPGSPEAAAVAADNAARAVNLDDGASIDFAPFTPNANQSIPLPWLTPASATSAATPVRVGAAADLKVPVIFEFRNNTWKFQPRSQVTAATDQDTATFANTRQAAPKNVGGDLKLATFNVLNYFNTTGKDWAAAAPGRTCTYFNDRLGNAITNDNCSPDGPRGAADAASLSRQQAKIVRALSNMDADVVGLQEIENSAALGEPRDDALSALVNALNTQAGFTRWAFAPSPAVLPADEDVIRTAFIFNPDTVSRVQQSQVLVDSAPFGNARQPLAQAFKPEGAPNSDAFAVVVNHFKSKSGTGNGDNASGPDGQGAFNGDRTRQAGALVTFANSFAASRGTNKIFLTGDFNSYTREDPIRVLNTAGFGVIDSDSPGDYSYSFSGLSGSLDHVLANSQASAMVTGSDVWESNANESIAYEYSRFNYNITNFHAPTPYAASDHNSQIVGLATDAPAVENIQILGTNDFHGRITRNASGAEAGAAVLAGAVKELRAANPKTIFAAAGDLIGASTFESFIQNDKPTIDALNEAGLDVSSVGNHEFDQGYDDLVNRVMADYDPDDNPEGGAEWKYLGANVKFKATGNPALPATWIKDFGDVEVGFVGAVTEDLPSLVSPDGIAEIEATDIVEATNEASADLKAEGADVVVLLVHEGATTTAYADAVDPGSKFGRIVNGVNADVDAIISGHTHLAYNHRVPVPAWAAQDRAVTKRPVVSAGQYGANLNRLRFQVDADSGEVLGIRTSILALQTSDGATVPGPTFTPNYPSDPATAALVAAAVAAAEVLGAVPLGKISAPLNRAKLANGTTENRGGESTLGNLVAEVQQWATQSPNTGSAQIAFMNPGGLRSDIVPAPDGTVTYRQAATTQSFANTLVNMDLTGVQIKAVLEQQWQPTGSSRPFLRLGASEGFTYTYDPAKAAGSRITAMNLDGTALQPGTTYSVTANSFLAAGGDNFTAFAGGTAKQDTGQSDLQAVVDYFAEYASGSTPLQVDYSQRAVGAAFAADAPASYAPGSQVRFSLSSLAMSTAPDTKDSTVSVSLGGTSVGSFPVDNTIGTDIRDEYGTASVAVTLPAGATAGATVLTVTGAATGTSAQVPITVTGGGSTPPPPPPPPGPTATTITGTAPTVTYGESATVTAMLTPAAATGQVVLLNGATVVGQANLSGGTATFAVPAKLLPPGGYTLTLRYAGDASFTASSTSVEHTVAKVVPTMKVKAPEKIDKGNRAKVVVKLAAGFDVAVTGKVEVTIKSGKTLTGTLKAGKVVFKLPKAQQTGKLRLKVVYLGSDLVAKAKERRTIKVVN